MRLRPRGIPRPPNTGDRATDSFLHELRAAIDGLPFSYFSTSDGPNESGRSAPLGTIGIEIGSGVTKFWLKGEESSFTTGWHSILTTAPAGLSESSRNTFTAQQNFHDAAKIGASGSAISSVEAYQKVMSAAFDIGPSASTLITITNSPSPSDKTASLSVSLQAPRGAAIQATSYYNVTDDFLELSLFNPSSTTLTLSAQTITVTAVRYA